MPRDSMAHRNASTVRADSAIGPYATSSAASTAWRPTTAARCSVTAATSSAAGRSQRAWNTGRRSPSPMTTTVCAGVTPSRHGTTAATSVGDFSGGSATSTTASLRRTAAGAEPGARPAVDDTPPSTVHRPPNVRRDAVHRPARRTRAGASSALSRDTRPPADPIAASLPTVDLAYLRAHPDHLPTFLTHQRIRETPVHGGSIAVASRLTLDDGASVFAKRWPEPAAAVTPSRPNTRPAGFFDAEAAGIGWLRVDGGAPLPDVIAALPDMLALAWIDEGPPSAGSARAFGAALARTHRAGAPAFGAAWPGYIGALPLDNTESAGPWSTWFAARRLEPYLRMSVDRGAIGAADAAAVEALATDIAIYAGEPTPSPRPASTATSGRGICCGRPAGRST